MAYDKVVDSAQLETAITATANAIREKTGDAALLQWLEDKGFADAIAAIEAGGGSGGDGGVFATGSITPASSTTYVEIAHELGKIPKFAIIIDTNITIQDIIGAVTYSYYIDEKTHRHACYKSGSWNNMSYPGNIEATYAASYMYGKWNSATKSIVRCGPSSGQNGFISGVTYTWIIGA